MTPTVTIVIPAYQAGRYIGEMMDSVLPEVAESTEILIVNDGSTDNTAEILARYDDPRIRVLTQDNQGVVAALNYGLEQARGAFVARLDADDWLVPGRIDAQLAVMAADPDVVCVGTDYVLVFEDGAESAPIRMPESDRACRERLSLASCHCGASVLLRMSAIRKAGIQFTPGLVQAEDYEFFTRVAALGKLANLPIPGYRYRIHGEQVTASDVRDAHATHITVAHRYAASIGRNPVPAEYLSALLWPEGSRAVRAWKASRAALSVLRRQRGIESVRFVGRKLIESAARR